MKEKNGEKLKMWVWCKTKDDNFNIAGLVAFYTHFLIKNRNFYDGENIGYII
jgi:hypothetical protein